MSISNHKKYLEYIYTLEDSKKWCFSQRFFHRKILYSNNRITSKLKHSKKFHIIKNLIKISNFLKINITLIYLIFISILTTSYLIGSLFKKKLVYEDSDFYLFGLGLIREKSILSHLNKQLKKKTIYININNLNFFNFPIKYNLIDIYKSSFKKFLESKKDLIYAKQKLSFLDDEYILAFLLLNSHRYIFLKYIYEYFFNKKNFKKKAFFSFKSTQCFPAFEFNKINKIYFSHGMITKTEIFPNFDNIYVNHPDEIIYVQKVLPNAKFDAIKYKKIPINTLNKNRILVATNIISSSGKKENTLDPIIKWAFDQNLEIYLKLHPGEKNNAYFDKLLDQKLVNLVPTDKDFQTTLLEYKPCLVFSWFSTVLIESLNMGVIPVKITNIDDEYQYDIAYKFSSRTLNFKKDLLLMLLKTEVAYCKILNKLCST